MSQDANLPDIRIDPNALYREETYSDLRAGSLRRMVPVTSEGKDDPTRPVIYEGHASLMTQGGALPLQFPIEAGSLAEALAQFPEMAQQALVQTLDELRRLQREAQSSIVVPGAGGFGGGGKGGGLIRP